MSRDPGSTVTYDLSVGGTSIEVGLIGVGGGEVTINVPAGQSQLTIVVRAPESQFGIATGRYRIDYQRSALGLGVTAQRTNQDLKSGFFRQRAQALIALQRRHIGKALGSGGFQSAERCLDVALQ